MKFATCLPKGMVDSIKAEMTDAKVTELILMSSKERRAYFTKILGSEEHAIFLNQNFEKSIVAKNQLLSIKNLMAKVTGLKPETRRDMIAKVERMTAQGIMQPAEVDLFLADLAEQKLGVAITPQEAQNLSELAKIAETRRGLVTDWSEKGVNSLPMQYGRAKVAFDNYINQLKDEANGIHLSTFKEHPVKAVKQLLAEIPGTTKAAKSSMDHSALFNQGWAMLCTHPTIWAKNALISTKAIVQSLGGKEVMDEFNAMVASDELAINGTFRAMELDVYGVREESYPTSILQKIPILGRFYKASEVGFVLFNQKNRFDAAKMYYKIAKKSGVDITNKRELLQIGRMCNSLTARGHLGKLEPVASTINNVFFSPRRLVGLWDVLTMHGFRKDVTPFVRKQAAWNLLKIVMATSAILVIAKSLDDKSVDWDPRSANFGKIKVRNTRFDVSGGMASLVVLASRFGARSTKSSITGKITELNSGEWGSMTVLDVIVNFFMNKLSPIAGTFADFFFEGEDFNGDKPTIEGAAADLLLPLGIQNDFEAMKDPKSADTLAVVIADALGISTNTYGKRSK